jgi:hypothetical protein
MELEELYRLLATSPLSFAEAQARLVATHSMAATSEPNDFVGINARPERASEYIEQFFAVSRPHDCETMIFAEVLVDALWAWAWEEAEPDSLSCRPLSDQELQHFIERLGNNVWTAHFCRNYARTDPESTPTRFALAVRQSRWYRDATC